MRGVSIDRGQSFDIAIAKSMGRAGLGEGATAIATAASSGDGAGSSSIAAGVQRFF